MKEMGATELSLREKVASQMLSGFTDAAAAPGDESLLQNMPHNFARLSLSSEGGMRARECLTQQKSLGPGAGLAQK